MTRRKEFRMNTTFILCLLLVFLLLLPTLLLVNYTAQKSIEQTKLAVADMTTVIGQLVEKQIEGQVGLLTKMTQGFYSKTIQSILRSSTYQFEKYSDIEERNYLENYLDSLSGLSDFVSGIYVVSASNNLYYSASSAIDPDHTKKQIDLLQEYGEKTDYWYQGPHTPWLANRGYERTVISIGRSLFDLTGNLLGIVYFDIDTDHFIKLLAWPQTPVAFDVILMDDDGKIISAVRNGDAHYYELITDGFEAGYVISEDSGYQSVVQISDLNWQLIGAVSENSIREEIHPLVRLRTIVVVVALLSGAALLLYIVLRIYQPLNKLLNAISLTSEEKLVECEESSLPDEFGYLIESYNSMVHLINDLIQQKYAYELKKRNIEMEDLKERIDPHFIMNTMQVISSSAIINQDYETEELIQVFCRMLRYSLYESGSIVPLSSEIAQVEQYCLLRDKVLGRKLDFVCLIRDDLLEYPVMKMLLQPIIENCYFHAFVGAEGERIQIMAELSNGFLSICVEDNGRGMNAEKLAIVRKSISNEEPTVKKQHGIALKNISDRLLLVYGGDAALLIDSVAGKGTRVIIRIPEGNNHGTAQNDNS